MNAAVSLLAAATLIAIDPREVEVDLGGRIGFYFEDKAEAFASMFLADGQRDPVKVSRNTTGNGLPWRLHVGLHRTMGVRLAELPVVYAIEVTGTPEQLRDLEASENLHRRPIAPVERAKFVHALCEAAKARIAREHGNLKQSQLAAKARWDRVRAGELRVEEALQEETADAVDKMSTAYGWKQAAAEALGLGPREIQRSLALYRLVVEPFPDLAWPLAQHPVVGENAAQLRRIAEVQGEAQRRKVIEALLADPEIGADDARILAEVDRPAGPAPAPQQKHYDAIVGGWSRLNLGQQRDFIPRIAAMLNTEGLKRSMRDRLNDELGEAATAERKVGVAQAEGTLADTIGLITRLLDGSGVDDEELEQLRRAAQCVVFDVPSAESPAAEEPLVFSPRSTASAR